MARLRLLLALLCLALLAACSSVGTSVLLGRDLSFTAPQLQSQLDRKFPRDYRKLGGLLSFSLMNPRLTLPGGGRLHLAFDIGMGGPGGSPRTPSGRFEVESGLRFDPGTRGLHLVDPHLEHLGSAAGGRGLPGGSRDVLQDLIREYARTRPLYRLSAEDLAQVPGTLTADSLRIRDGHVELQLPVDGTR